MIKLVVFDWNGTLFADTRIVLRAGNMTELKLLGVEPISLEKYQETYEMPLYRFYENLGISREVFNEKASQMSQLFHPVYEPLAARARTRTGTRQTLQHLKEQGVSMVILSNHAMEGIHLQLVRLKLEHFFDAVLANDDVETMHHTSKQHRIEHYLDAHQIEPSETLIIGDTTEEVRIGKSLGLRTVSITGGNNSKRRLVAAQPDTIIHKISDLIKVTEAIA